MGDEDRVEILKLLNRTSSIESDFDVSFKERDEDDEDDEDDEEVEFDFNMEDEEDKEDDDHHRRYVLLGEATLSDVSCEDQRKYRIRYARRHRDDKEDLELEHHHDDDPIVHPKGRGIFALRVRGCPKPKPPHPKPHPKPHPRPEPEY